MVLMYDGSRKETILSFDPSGECVGFCIAVVDREHNKMVPVHAGTIYINRHLKEYQSLIDLHGLRFARMLCLRDAVTSLLHAWHPTHVVSEAAFLGRFAAAFGSLTECIVTIKHAVYEYKKTIFVDTIEPSVVKEMLGVPGNSPDKSLVCAALQKNTHVVLSDIKIDDLDEHAVDAIGIGHAAFLRLLKLGGSNEPTRFVRSRKRRATKKPKGRRNRSQKVQ